MSLLLFFLMVAGGIVLFAVTIAWDQKRMRDSFRRGYDLGKEHRS